MSTNTYEKIVPDTSAIIECVLSERIEKRELEPQQILIHNASVAELEHQANQGKTIGFFGLEEIKKLRKLGEEKGFELHFSGSRPRWSEIQLAKSGEIDALIRQLAFEESATLITFDLVQATVAEAQGIDVLFIKQPPAEKKALKLERYFDGQTMSVHLREGTEPAAKRGEPGSWKFDILEQKKLKQENVKEIAKEIIEKAKVRRDSFIEIERPGSTIVQLGDFRIVITQPPFSDGWEITAVRPVKKLDLQEYKMSEKLLARVTGEAEGILIAGSPGHGKSTFARALVEWYAAQGRIVKTVESPRDMQLSEKITQYSITLGTPEEVRDVLLLSRPDNTLFDEMRNTSDFLLYADLRLAGVGMAGVVHGTDPIDAIQRFLGRVELGVIPHIIDTVVFIRNGQIGKVLALQFTVKVPSGMTEADLARPIVLVSDFETGKVEYEIYTYGEQTVVVPVQRSSAKKAAWRLAEEAVKEKMKHWTHDCETELIGEDRAKVYVPAADIARIIGKEGKTIEQIEKAIGIKIDVEELRREQHVPFELSQDRRDIVFYVSKLYAHHSFELYDGEDMLMRVHSGKKGVININKESAMGKNVLRAVEKGTVKLVMVG